VSWCAHRAPPAAQAPIGVWDRSLIACTRGCSRSEAFHSEAFHSEAFHSEAFHSEAFHSEAFHSGCACAGDARVAP